MEDTTTRLMARQGLLIALGIVLGVSAAEAIVPRTEGGLARKQFARPDLYITSVNAPLADVIDRLPNRADWDAFAGSRAADGSAFAVFIDPRSGTATNIMGAVPLIPGSGVGNAVTLESLGQRLRRTVERVDAATVAEATVAFIRQRREVLGVDPDQLGAVRATPITADLWQVSIPQQYHGIPVRYGHLAASISHGNLVTIGAGTWGNVGLRDVTPAISSDAAMDAGFAHAEGRQPADQIVRAPALEIVPFAPSEHQSGQVFVGPVGGGYGHRLVWTFLFRRPSSSGTWEVMVDAHSGDVLAFGDTDHHVQRRVTGGVYPLANTGTCPTPQTCGAMQFDWPMPFADTAMPAPNAFTNGAGVYDFRGGTATTTLRGRFFTMRAGCGPLSVSSGSGEIGLGGVNGEHDCIFAPADSPPNNAASRTAFYELNKIAEIARGYLPNNAWLRGQLGPLLSELNLGTAFGVCNAFYRDKGNTNGPGYIRFMPSGEDLNGDVCRNTGEIAEVADHEWGHGLDDHDANGVFSNSSEGYADIAALYRNQSSCLGYGFFQSSPNFPCGGNSDGPNVDEAQDGPTYCTTACSGVRDADFAKHVPPTAATAVDFVCNQCVEDTIQPGPCGREDHCASAPLRQAAWDLVARDLAVAPFGYDSQTAFIVANKLFYQGSGNVGQAFACACGGTSNGCAADNTYIQWVTADDDNGNLNDGTPHITAIFNAFDRHGIACKSIPHVNSGCPAGPGVAPTVTATPGGYRVSLSWNAVPAATRYWVFRTEGHAGCDYGKALIAEVTGLNYTDTEVAALRPYSYNVVAAGASSACYSRASNCATVFPNLVNYTVSCAPSITNGAPATCTVRSNSDFSSPVTLRCADLPGTASCTFSPATVTPPRNGSASTTLTVSSGVTPPGVYLLRVRGSLPSTPAADNSTTVQWTLTDANGGTGNLAAYSTTLSAPACSALARSCDTGLSLVRGRGSLGPEPNAPNTITPLFQQTCPDGSGVLFPNTKTFGSNDRLMVYTVDGSNLAAGKQVRVDAMVTPRDALTSDAADFFAAANASNPNWVFIGTRVPTTRVPQMLSVTYALPPGSTQAVRVQFRYLGAHAACAPGPYNDRDDLAFRVGN